jgi:hypothetical protein
MRSTAVTCLAIPVVYIGMKARNACACALAPCYFREKRLDATDS